MKYLYTCLVVLCSFTTAFAQPTFTITPSTTTAVDPGETITFDVTVTNFTSIISVQFGMAWDPSVLSFVSIDDPNNTDFPGLATSNFGTTSPGKIGLSWFESSITAIDVADDVRMFSFTLMSIGGGSTSVGVDPDAAQEIIDGTESEIGLMSMDTSVEVTGGAAATCSDGIQNQGETGIDCGGPCDACPTCSDGIQNGDETGVDCGGSCSPCDTGGGGGGGGGNTDFELIVTGGTVEPGDEVCLDVTTNNFTDLVSIQLSMSWDPNALEFTRIENTTTAIPAFGQENFGFTETANGDLRLSWNSSDPSMGTTLAAGTVIYQICFLATGANGTNTSVEFSNSPLSIEASDVNDNFPDVNTTNAQVLIQGEVDPPADCPEDSAPFCIANTNGGVGETICVPISAQNFDNILSFQHSIAFNAAALRFSSINISGNLDGLAESQFSTGGADMGFISVSWFDNNIQGITLTNGTVLYELCFEILSEGTHLISFSEDPVPYEIIDGNEQEVTFNGANGSVQGTTEVEPCAGVATTSITGSMMDVDCRGNSTGSIDISVTEGGGEYAFAWSNAGTTEDLSDLAAGTYTVTVSSACSEPQTMSFTINEPTDGINLTTMLTNGVSCFGEATGAIDVEASGGTGELDFAWTGAGTQAGMADQSGLVAGDYVITVTDDSGCSISETVTVTGPTAALSAEPIIQDAACGGDANGSINLNITGGTGSYTVMWSDNQTGVMRTGLAEGDYTPTSIMDENGCTLEIGTQTVGGAGAAISITSETTPVTAEMNGSINVTISGGTEPYMYAWSNGATTEDIDGLELAGAYTLTVTDAGGCEETFMISLAQPILIDGSVNNACDGADNGSVTILTSGGVLPYTYAWTDSEGNSIGNATEVLDNVGTGMVTVMVTDGGGTTQTASFTIEASPAFTIIEDITNETVTGINDNGAINLDVTGGTGTLMYAWSDASLGNTPNISGLDSGDYTVTITDENRCMEAATFNVGYIASTPVPGNYMTNDASCAGVQDGSLSFTITNGDPNYTITLNGGDIVNEPMTLTEYNPTYSRDNLTAGRYDISIMDNNGLDTMVTVTITAPEAFTVAGTIGSNTDEVNCNGNIGLTLEGGAGGETYLWSNGGTTSTITSLCAEQYTVSITDANGCMQVETFDLTLFAADAVTNPTLCPEGDATGNIDLNVNGGIGPFTYNWSTGDITEDVMGVAAGEYTVTITEASGTSITQSFTVMSTSDLAVNVLNNQNANGFGVSCNGATDAELTAMGINSNQYAYQWTDGTGNPIGDNTANLTGVGVGTYMVQVTDEQNCVVTSSIEVVEPTALVSTMDILDIECNGDGNGEAMVVVDGGVRNSTNTYDYTWSHTEDNNFPAALGLLGGSYTVTITDGNGCTLVDSLFVMEPDSLVVLTDITPFSVNSTGSITTQISGGTASYRYEWTNTKSNELVGVTAELTDLTSEQTLCLLVTDLNGCTAKVAPLDVFNLTDCLKTPPVLTPNGDGINELFEIKCLAQYPDNSMEVYSRWGQLIYAKTGYDNSWTGRDEDGMQLPNGAYYYVFRYTDQNGDSQQERGSISILND